MIRFSDDDLGYLAWIAAHPNGFVLNIRCSPDANCVILHRASCTSISNDTYEPGAYTGRNHRKLCATNKAELKLAAKDLGRRDGTFSKHCGLCRPLTFALVSDGDRATGCYETGEKATASIGLPSATLDELFLPRPVIRLSV